MLCSYIISKNNNYIIAKIEGKGNYYRMLVVIQISTNNVETNIEFSQNRSPIWPSSTIYGTIAQGL